ncbi:hypothetical protein [Mesorhizobium sp. LC103]|uniref:hypothetical protein n=1 Tax=Aquamicrobium sp. LC103 TaxID=1120658 RepID=UPI000699B5FC
MSNLTLSTAILGAVLCLAACASTQDVLEPSALTAEPASGTQPSFPAAGTPAVAAVTTDARVQFAPVIGATTEATGPLSARLSTRAQERGISLVAAGDTSATHVVKGYFSALSDNGETTVIYVWDVMDAAGNRIHRIQGQQKAPSRGAEGWPSVTPSTMEAVADSTVDQLAGWLTARPG